MKSGFNRNPEIDLIKPIKNRDSCNRLCIQETGKMNNEYFRSGW